MERIGAYLTVSGPLYSNAIDALGGNKSVRFAHAKLLVGLSGGGVASQLRQSSAGVRTFMLTAALKGCMYDDREIGQVLYDFMDVQGILHHQAASIRQLQSVVSVLSSNCEQLLPSIMDTHQEIVRKLTYEANETWTGQYFGVFECKEMAKLLAPAFSAIQDRSIDYVELTGVVGLIWLASLLLWMNPDEVGLFCWGRRMMGAANGKVRMEIDSATDSPASQDASWKVRTWKSGKWTEYIISAVEQLERFNRVRARDKVPRQSVRSFLLERDVDDLDQKNAIIGGIAAGLVDAAMKFGRLSDTHFEGTPGIGRGLRIQSRRIVRYIDLCPEGGKQRGGTIVQDFGWNRESITDHQNRLVNFFSGRSGKLTEDLIAKYIRQEYPEFDEGQEGEITASASKVAVHAIMAFHQEHDSLVPFYYNDLDSRGVWQIWSQGENLLPFDTLRNKCYQLAGFEHDTLAPGYNSLILASDGRVAYPQVCVDHATSQGGLLELDIVAGHVRFENSTYSAVVEQRGDRHAVPSKTAHQHWSVSILDKESHAFSLDVSPDQFLATDGSRQNHTSTIDYHFAVDDTRLLMRTYLCSPASGRRDVNYREVVQELAFAKHLNPGKSLSTCQSSSMT